MEAIKIQKSILVSAILGCCSLFANAQGVIVYKNNGQSIRIPYEELDSIKSFQYDEVYNEDSIYIESTSYPIQNQIPGSFSVFEVNGVQFRMIDVNGGSFEMGSNDQSTTKPVHTVTLSDYQVAETEVTEELWTAVMNDNPSRYLGNGKLPVNNVTWDESQIFIEKLNQITGETFRLPTEAEWEFAAKGGNNSNGYFYSGSEDYNEVCWSVDNSGDTYMDYDTGELIYACCPHPVGTKHANELGICDMSGNMLEWCQDYYADYSYGHQINPVVTTISTAYGNYKVARGGCFMNQTNLCNTTTRWQLRSYVSGKQQGLRLARTPNHNTDEGTTYTLECSTNEIRFPYQASSDVFEISSNDSWIAFTNNDWCTLSQDSGTGNATITVNVEKRVISKYRECYITIYGQNSQKELWIRVYQAPKP